MSILNQYFLVAKEATSRNQQKVKTNTPTIDAKTAPDVDQQQAPAVPWLLFDANSGLLYLHVFPYLLIVFFDHIWESINTKLYLHISFNVDLKIASKTCAKLGVRLA